MWDVIERCERAIQNSGGVRTNFLQGKFTMADAYTMLPFSNTITTLKLTGEEICNVLDEAIRYSQGISQSTGAFPYSSHLRYDVYLNAGDGVKSAYNVEIKDKKTGAWSPVDMKKTYVVVTNSFTALGKDGYVTFSKAIERDPNVKNETYIEYAVPLVELFTKHLNGGELVKPNANNYCLKSVKDWETEQTKSTETPVGEPSVKPADTKTYTVVEGDSLSKIAKKTLNDAKLWEKIYQLNKDTIKNPNLIYPGQIIVLP